MQAGGFDKKLVDYFISDTVELHQLIRLWKFDNDADRREHCKRLFESQAFMAFAKQSRPLVKTHEVQLLQSAPWGPQP